MKKVLSVAMASAMVLGMGANAFAIQYSTGSNETASWPKNFGFEGSLFVTDKDGNIVESTLTDLNGKTRVDFQPGDVIWMPLYADDQLSYTVDGYNKGQSEVAASTVTLDGVEVASKDGEIEIDSNSKVKAFNWVDNQNKVVYYYTGSDTAVEKTQIGTYKAADGWRFAQLFSKDLTTYVNGKAETVLYGTIDKVQQVNMTLADAGVAAKLATGTLASTTNTAEDTANKVTVQVNGITYEGKYLDYTKGANASVSFELPGEIAQYLVGEITNTLKEKNPTAASSISVTSATTSDTTVTIPSTTVIGTYDTVVKASGVLPGVTVKVNLPKVAAVSENLGTVDTEKDKWNTVSNKVAHGHYTGNIDKNWSINLIEEDNGVADLVEKAELYKADEVDYLSYNKYTTEIMPNAVYLKVTLKDSWKLADDANLKYYVYVADNKSGKETNKVWVSGNYAASYQYVDFTWTNDASKAGLWKVKDGENGVAVFDFADKAFFQVKMYSKESMYLDLSTAYDKAIAGDFSEADAFFSFDNENANFSRTGTLILVSDDASLVPYQVTKDGYTKVDAEYVEGFAIAHTNKKVNGFVFETKELGNYVLSTEEVEVEEDDKDDDKDDNTQEVVVPDDDNKETNNNSKPNPITGAEDFVGLAVSLAVVSVAAAGALALKK